MKISFCLTAFLVLMDVDVDVCLVQLMCTTMKEALRIVSVLVPLMDLQIVVLTAWLPAVLQYAFHASEAWVFLVIMPSDKGRETGSRSLAAAVRMSFQAVGPYSVLHTPDSRFQIQDSRGKIQEAVLLTLIFLGWAVFLG
jgi:hypothetical protein